MVAIKQIFGIIKIPLGLLIALTCVGVLLNFLNNYIIIIGWWVLVLVLCALSAVWGGFETAKKQLSITESGLAGAITWLIPGTVGLVIVGINMFIKALLWGSIEGYEAIAFIIGLIIIVILLVVGAVITFVLGMCGGLLGKNLK